MISVKNLSLSYTPLSFIQNMSFEVAEGEIFGFLGPSCAGKSTLQKILTDLITNYSGSVRLADMECKNHPNHFYETIGVDFEYSTMYEKLTARQNLAFFGSLYSKQARPLEELLEKIGLANDADKRIVEYSKGMRSRINFVKALIHDPAILFLDEPTSGLDPTNSRMMKDMILAEKAQGKTILLTTHNMTDAAELCDRVAFIVNGEIAALDTPQHMIMQKGAAKVHYTYFDEGEKKNSCLLEDLSEDQLFAQLMREKQLTSVHSSEPDLSDIFIEVTGRQLV
ncbi:ABC transporter ATP-binding protein [Enterococcus sp. AZ072]|uniref:ABC transporter ATP-binding protein n=1 Tax=unclassified Enterococcus TaxID=2608891 RepID=UPI003D290496